MKYKKKTIPHLENSSNILSKNGRSRKKSMPLTIYTAVHISGLVQKL